MDKYAHIVELLAAWEEQARQALPADAMLLNKQIRELREALYVVTQSSAYVLIQRVDAKRLVQGDTNSPGYDLSCRRVAAMIAARPEAP